MEDRARTEPGIFIDLKEASFLEYCDHTMMTNEPLINDRGPRGGEAARWLLWDAADSKRDVTPAYLGSLLFASGHACVEDMFYGLMAHSLPVSKYAVDASVIDYLVEDRRRGLEAGSEETGGRSGSSSSASSSPLTLEFIPPMFTGMPFKRLFEHLMKFEKKIALAIYRQYRVTRDYSGQRRPKMLVLCCPSQQLRLAQHDQVYVLRPCSTEELHVERGLL